MSNFSDLHHISDISNISMISHCSGKLIGRIDSAQSLLDNHSGIIGTGNKFATNHETNAIEKAMKSLVLCEENISKHIKTNIIYQCIEEASLNYKDILSDSTAGKLRTLLLIHELDKYMHLPSSTKQNELTLLGIIDVPPSDLTPNEKLDVKCCIETMLREKIHEMLLRYEVLGGNVKETLKKNEYNVRNKFLEYHDMPEVQWKSRIKELILQCESDLSEYANLIDKWNKLKYEDMNQSYLEKTGHFLLQAQVAELQARITKLSCMIRMFKETPTTIDAFKALNRLVEKKLEEVTDEIRQKEDLRKLYDNLKNTEYDQVLQTYLQFCNAIKKKKHILDTLK